MLMARPMRKPGFLLSLKKRTKFSAVSIFVLFSMFITTGNLASFAHAQQIQPKFKVVAIAEKGGIHKPFVDAARVWLEREAVADGFTVDYIENTDKIDDAFLSQYAVFIQLNFPPYSWTPTAMAAFQRYVEEGRGGWIGFHHATLLGEFDGYPMWPWFSSFMGGIRFTKYIPTFATGTVSVEDPKHPVMKNLPSQFVIENEEWYTYDKSPRPNVHVLASVDEKSYSPASDIKMGDHPVVWTNEHMKARNVYIFMGHHGELFQNRAFTTLFHNSILWAAHQ
jgi:type 1 glutamine amidotransferase